MGRLPQTKYYLSDFPSKITVIRRHHPLKGQALELLSVGKASVVVRLGDGSSLKIARGWTDADGGPCTALYGNSKLCLMGLRELLNLVKALRGPTDAAAVFMGEKIEPLCRNRIGHDTGVVDSRHPLGDTCSQDQRQKRSLRNLSFRLFPLAELELPRRTIAFLPGTP